MQTKYTPFITIPSPEENNQTEDYYYDEDDHSKFEYLESRSAEYVPPPSYILENQRPQKVTVRVENYIPLGDDTAQVLKKFTLNIVFLPSSMLNFVDQYKSWKKCRASYIVISF